MVTMNRVTAVFDNFAQAEQAVQALRQMGVRDDHLSVVSQHNAGGGQAAAATSTHAAHDDHSGSNATKGLIAGASVGSLFGIAAALIPGVGPFITAGTLLTTALGAVGGGAVAGALVGGTTGLVAGALAKSGYDEHEAHYYGSAVEQGGILLAVNAVDGLSTDQIRATLSQYGARYFQAGSA